MKTEKLIKRLEQRYMGHGVSIPESECFLYGLSRKSWFDQVFQLEKKAVLIKKKQRY